jgi:hypothetical protein
VIKDNRTRIIDNETIINYLNGSRISEAGETSAEIINDDVGNAGQAEEIKRLGSNG